MKRHGFTVVELIVVMAIFALTMTFVFFDFRQADERASLRRAALDMVERLQEIRVWAQVNRQPTTFVRVGSTFVTAYGMQARIGTNEIGYGWREDSSQEFIDQGSSTVANQLWFANRLNGDPDIVVHDAWTGAASLAFWGYVSTRFQTGQGTLLNKAGTFNPAVGFEGDFELRYYLRYRNDLSRCREVAVRGSGSISQKEVIPCP